MIKLTKTLKDGRTFEMNAADQKQADQLLKDARYSLAEPVKHVVEKQVEKPTKKAKGDPDPDSEGGD